MRAMLCTNTLTFSSTIYNFTGFIREACRRGDRGWNGEDARAGNGHGFGHTAHTDESQAESSSTEGSVHRRGAAQAVRGGGAREGAGFWIVREEGGAIRAQAAAEPGARSAFHGSCTPFCCIRSAVSAVGCVASEGFCSRSALR